MSCRKHGYPWPSLASSPNRSLHPAGLQGYIPYSHRMYVRAGRPAIARPYVWVHRSTPLKSSSLLLQQCPEYGLPKETVAAITILYKNTKVKVCSLDGDTEYFDIIAGVLQGNPLAPYLFIICLDYMLRTSIDKIRENGFELTKKRSRRYPAKTITDADYADDIAILANTPNQAEIQQHSLERATASIGLHDNAHKTEYMCYTQTGDISALEGTSLKLVDKFS